MFLMWLYQTLEEKIVLRSIGRKENYSKNFISTEKKVYLN